MKDKFRAYTNFSIKAFQWIDRFLGDKKEPKLCTFTVTFITLLIAITGMRQAFLMALASLVSMHLFGYLLEKNSNNEK